MKWGQVGGWGGLGTQRLSWFTLQQEEVGKIDCGRIERQTKRWRIHDDFNKKLGK